MIIINIYFITIITNTYENTEIYGSLNMFKYNSFGDELNNTFYLQNTGNVMIKSVGYSEIYLGQGNNFDLECISPRYECRENDIYSLIDPEITSVEWNIYCESFEYCGCPNDDICLYGIRLHFEAIDRICEYIDDYAGCGFLTQDPSLSPTESPTIVNNDSPSIAPTTSPIVNNVDGKEEEDEGPSKYQGTVIGIIVTLIILIWIFLIFKFCIVPRWNERQKLHGGIPRKKSREERRQNSSNHNENQSGEIELQKTEYGYASVSDDGNKTNDNDAMS